MFDNIVKCLIAIILLWIVSLSIVHSYVIATVITILITGALLWFVLVAAEQEQRNETDYKEKFANAYIDNPVLGIEADNLTGESFEKYCADLLYAVGFGNIQLTPASGDNGIDIKASYNGVRAGLKSPFRAGLI